MLVAAEIKGELARIHPARACCRRAELLGLVFGADAPGGRRARQPRESARRGARTGDQRGLRTLDHATARTAVHLAASLGIDVPAPESGPRPAAGVTRAATRPGAGRSASHGRHHLTVRLDPSPLGPWSWSDAQACDRRAFLRGVLLGSGSLSFGTGGAHVEAVLPSRARAVQLQRWLAGVDIRALLAERRRRHVVYLKGQEEIATLLRFVGANRGLMELEVSRVGRDVRNRLNRLLNAEDANLDRTVRAADRQLEAIERLERDGRLGSLTRPLRDAAAERRRQPDGDLEALAGALGISRSAANHRLRRLVQHAAELDSSVG